MPISRRDLLKRGVDSSMLLYLRAAATGLPVNFLLTGHVDACENCENNDAKFLILSTSGAGETFNCNGPGAYDHEWVQQPSSSVLRGVSPDVVSNLKLELSQTINGNAYTIEDVTQGVPLWRDQSSARAARVYQSLPTAFRDHLTFFNFRTNTGVHQDMPRVITGHGAVLGPDARGNEMLPSAVAQENASALATMTDKPFCLGHKTSITYGGAAIRDIPPTALKSSLLSMSPAFDSFATLYTSTLDMVTQNLKANGKAFQKSYLDEHVLTFRQAKELGAELGDLLLGVEDNSMLSQLKTALALIKLKYTPVVVTQHELAGDNHRPYGILNEVDGTLKYVSALNDYWAEVQRLGLADKIVYATLDTFGRSPYLLNYDDGGVGGRGHYPQLSTGIIHAPGTSMGRLIGGLELNDEGAHRKTYLSCSGINSEDGSPNNPDIDRQNTLSSYLKTVMTMTGVSVQRCDVRIPGAKSVRAAFV